MLSFLGTVAEFLAKNIVKFFWLALLLTTFFAGGKVIGFILGMFEFVFASFCVVGVSSESIALAGSMLGVFAIGFILYKVYKSFIKTD